MCRFFSQLFFCVSCAVSNSCYYKRLTCEGRTSVVHRAIHCVIVENVSVEPTRACSFSPKFNSVHIACCKASEPAHHRTHAPIFFKSMEQPIAFFLCVNVAVDLLLQEYTDDVVIFLDGDASHVLQKLALTAGLSWGSN